MKKIFMLVFLLMAIDVMADRNKCLSKGICTCRDYTLIFYEKINLYNNSKNKIQKELSLLSANSYLNSLYKECRDTKYYKKNKVQKNLKIVKDKLKTEVRESLRNIEHNKPLY